MQYYSCGSNVAVKHYNTGNPHLRRCSFNKHRTFTTFINPKKLTRLADEMTQNCWMRFTVARCFFFSVLLEPFQGSKVELDIGKELGTLTVSEPLCPSPVRCSHQ